MVAPPVAWPGSRWPFYIPKALWPVPCVVTLCQVSLFRKTIFPDLLGNTYKEVGAGDGCCPITVPPLLPKSHSLSGDKVTSN